MNIILFHVNPSGSADKYFFSVLQRLSGAAPWWSPMEAVLIEGDPFLPFGYNLALSLTFDSFNMYS